MTANLCIKRDTLINYPFDETLEKYGYEDILMGTTLKENGHVIIHIDNPIVHKGIKKSVDFISGQKQAVTNLAHLYFDGRISNTRLIDFYERLKSLGIKSFVTGWVASQIKSIEQGFFDGDNTSLIRLDLLKLYYFDISLKKLYNQD